MNAAQKPRPPQGPAAATLPELSPLVAALANPASLALAVVAGEVLGLPLALRPSGTLGPRDAF